jgi:GxxExxY protein
MRKSNDELQALSKQVLDICFRIHTQYGPGLYENFYEAVLCYELEKAGIFCQRQLEFHVMHDGKDMGLGYRMDVLVEEEFLVELKSKEAFSESDHKQTITYMKLNDIRLGLMVNFGVAHLKDGISRKVNGF